MKILFILIVAILALTSFTTAQYSRVAYFTDNKCANTATPILDIYLKSSTCTSTVVSNCTLYSTLSWYGYTTCAATVPASGKKNTLQLNIYSDNTCTTSSLSMSQIFPIDTCVAVPGTGSLKSTGCSKLTTYSDSACKTVKLSADYSAYNGVCNSGTKYICNDGDKIGMSVMVFIMIASLFSILF